MDDNVIDDEEPLDVPGCVEIHRVAGFEANVLVNATESSANEVTKGTSLLPAKKRKEVLTSSWKKNQPKYSKLYENSDVIETRRNDVIKKLRGKSPVECFEILFDNETVTYIVQQSVIYDRQKNNHQFQLSNNCLKKFIGILLFTGYHSLPQEQLYWCEDEDMKHSVC
ncbi:piggyBac transposable element-derived protein 2-like [Stegodyphus dumicola]|uniref:piggyBac transposable element-derived protein 2-like n=1 Tax=Stegodyphus dumicola TaxID=202533 RepID=UPI0015AD2F96|nr:piggyBac transposable element-derived protein 2-like [Stegodyphus dumicola]